MEIHDADVCKRFYGENIKPATRVEDERQDHGIQIGNGTNGNEIRPPLIKQIHNSRECRGKLEIP